MRLMFVYYVKEDRGSAQDMCNYATTARALGHEVALYGSPSHGSRFNYSLDIKTADAVICIFEWTTALQYGDNLDFARLLERVPRRRRVVIDCDGAYNDAIRMVGDVNHQDDAASQRWINVCDSLSDKIFQPTLHPLRPNVRPFLFHAYNPEWERSLEFRAKEYGMIYVGNNWFRWRGLQKVLKAVEPVRNQVGRIGLVGHGWQCRKPWADPRFGQDAYETDPVYLRMLRVASMSPVRFDCVIEHMSSAVCTPVIYRPLFDRLQLVTCRTFETPAANTIPLFCQEKQFVEEIYGDDALELVLPKESPHEKILEIVVRPDRYTRVATAIRRRLAERHSYYARFEQLIEIVKS
jgi:hypothetical protein